MDKVSGVFDVIHCLGFRTAFTTIIEVYTTINAKP